MHGRALRAKQGIWYGRRRDEWQDESRVQHTLASLSEVAHCDTPAKKSRARTPTRNATARVDKCLRVLKPPHGCEKDVRSWRE